jgi:hypothetical protein
MGSNRDPGDTLLLGPDRRNRARRDDGRPPRSTSTIELEFAEIVRDLEFDVTVRAPGFVVTDAMVTDRMRAPLDPTPSDITLLDSSAAILLFDDETPTLHGEKPVAAPRDDTRKIRRGP